MLWCSEPRPDYGTLFGSDRDDIQVRLFRYVSGDLFHIGFSSKKKDSLDQKVAKAMAIGNHMILRTRLGHELS